MPGLAALATKAVSTDSVAERLAMMESAMPTASSWIPFGWKSDSGHCAVAGYSRDPAARPAVAQAGSMRLALDGELYGLGQQRSRQAEHLLNRYLDGGLEALRQLEGRFVATLWCDRSKQLTVLTDKFASKPVYYSLRGDEFAVCTSVNALRTLIGDSPALNPAGLVQFFTFGHLWNDDTFYESVKSAMAASRIVFDAETGSVSVTQYWRPGNAQGKGGKERDLGRLTETFATAVADQSRYTDGLGVALSGGLDARTMLAFVDTDAVRPACVSLGMEGSLDQKSARRLAELAGCPFHSLVLGEGFLEGFLGHLQRMVELTDGHYLSQCIVMPTFPLYQSLGIRVLLRGHVGELLHMHKAYNFSVDASFDAIHSDAALEGWLWGRLQSHLTQGVNEPLLHGVTAEAFAESGRQSLRRALRATDHMEHPLDIISQLFLDQRTRRETAMSLVKFGSVVDPRLPYLDSRFINSVFAVDPALRVGEAIQTHMLRARRPEFLRPANSNTGAPVGVSQLRRTLSYLRMRVLAKLGVKGYQPYERLGLWLKRELRPVVEQILLDPACLERGLLNPDCVRAVVRRHMNSEANHTYLIMAMMIVELGMREGAKQDSGRSLSVR